MKRILFIYALFFIDTFAENFVEIFYSDAPYFDLSAPNDQVRIWNTCAAFTKILLYFIPLFLQRFKSLLEFDTLEKVILVTCMFFTFIDALDWVWSYNLRDSYMDWYVFVFVNLILLFIKFCQWKFKREQLR